MSPLLPSGGCFTAQATNSFHFCLKHFTFALGTALSHNLNSSACLGAQPRASPESRICSSFPFCLAGEARHFFRTLRTKFPLPVASTALCICLTWSVTGSQRFRRDVLVGCCYRLCHHLLSEHPSGSCPSPSWPHLGVSSHFMVVLTQLACPPRACLSPWPVS